MIFLASISDAVAEGVQAVEITKDNALFMEKIPARALVG